MGRSQLPHLLPTVAVALGGTVVTVAIGLWLGEGRPLDASYFGSAIDTDGDGIGDVAEIIGLTDPDSVDTDGDGFSDIEELARGMDPATGEAEGPSEARAVGLAATGDGQWVRTDVALYLPDGSYQGLALEFGAFAPVVGPNGVQAVQIPFPAALGPANGSLAVAPGREPGSLVVHFDVVLPQALFEALGWVPLYVTAGPAGGPVTAAAAQTIVYEGEALLSLEPLGPEVGYSASAQIGGVITRPIEPEDNIPTSMSINQVCIQNASPIGGGGGLVELLVDEAECVEADFLFCPSTCTAQIGSSRTIVDPLALIGG